MAVIVNVRVAPGPSLTPAAGDAADARPVLDRQPRARDVGAFDAGEGLPGAVAYLYSTSSSNQIEATTGADGRFTFTGLPAQRYGSFTRPLPDGWVHDSPREDVDGSDPGPAVRVRALRTFSETVHATGSFDRGTYQMGDAVKLHADQRQRRRPARDHRGL